jgi:hypothetical protein
LYHNPEKENPMNEETKLGWTSAKLDETFAQISMRLGGNQEAVRHLIKVYKYGEKPRFVRDWCVVDARRSSNTQGHPTIVFYVPTGASFVTLASDEHRFDDFA